MLAFLLLLASKQILEVASRSLRSSSSKKITSSVQGGDIQRLLHHIADCRTDPASCGDAADTMAKYSDNIANTVLKDINETQQDFIN